MRRDFSKVWTHNVSHTFLLFYGQGEWIDSRMGDSKERLNAGHLGGFRLESTIPQNSISAATCGGEASSEGGLGRQVMAQGASRRSYSSTAILGVALSVGACGLLSPTAGDAAIAAEKLTSEPLIAEPSAVAVPEMTTVPTVAVLNSSEAAQTTSEANSLASSSHTVQEGESLSQIAKIHGVSLTGIANLNNLQPDAVLLVGQVIALEVTGSMPESSAVPALPTKATMVKIRQDEAVSKLKEQQSRLKKSLAELRSEESKLASVPTLPVVESSTVFATHQVAPGENLSTIARVHGMSSRELASLNNIANPNLLKANQVLKVATTKVAPLKSESFQTIALATPSLSVTDSEGDAPAPPLPGQAIESRRYIDGLMADVVKARQKYQASSVAYRSESRGLQVSTESAFMPTPAMPVVVPSVRRSVNPEFQTRFTGSRSVSEPAQRSMPSVPKLSSPSAPRVIARASVGADAYAPLVQPSARRMVSPEMPAIGAAETYLPRKGGGASSGLIWPSQGTFTSGYGPRWGRMHRGIDIAAPTGTPIVAAAGGVVSYAGYNDGGFGYLVEIDHADGSMTRYAHNDRILVSVGQQVGQGDQVALMGSTGFSTGPHLHFEIHPAGQGAANPMAFLPNRG
jgi:murein DD-endopeptidase MepM/ murein hydrolase activator NlpD